MKLRNLGLLDWIMWMGVLASMALALGAGGCVHTPPPEDCCTRLDVRTKEMKVFDRYCTMLVFAGRKETDAKVTKDINRRLDLCKFVFGVETNQNLLSTLQEREQFHRVRYYRFSIEDGGWNPPLDCYPEEVGCEEF